MMLALFLFLEPELVIEPAYSPGILVDFTENWGPAVLT